MPGVYHGLISRATVLEDTVCAGLFTLKTLICSSNQFPTELLFFLYLLDSEFGSGMF